MEPPFKILLGLCLFFALTPEARAQPSGCAASKIFHTKVNINLVLVEEPYYDLKTDWVTLTENGKQRTQEWLEENDMQEVWSTDHMTTLGVASGGMGHSYSMQMQSGYVDPYGIHYCTYFREINVELFYRTMISIPREFKKGSCAFNMINEHELRHHVANSKAVQMYIDRLRKDIYTLVAHMESTQVKRGGIQARFKEMQAGMEDAINIYLYEYMGKEMDKLNAEVDTREEYAGNSGRMDECQKIDGVSYDYNAVRAAYQMQNLSLTPSAAKPAELHRQRP